MLASVVRSTLDLALPGGRGARLSVLAYHRVLAQPDPLQPGNPSAAEFERTMQWVKQTFSVVPLAEAIAGLSAGRLPCRALAITFDDGYADNETIAAPILARLGLHATFFIATGYLDGGRMFNDTVLEAVRGAQDAALDLTPIGLGRHAIAGDPARRRAIGEILAAIKYRPVAERIALAERIAECARVVPRNDLMMTSDQVTALVRRGFDLGGHTVTHPILAGLPASEAWREIELGHRHLAELAGRAIGLFAYPNGRPGRDYTAETVRLVRKAGFRGAVSTAAGAARPGTDPYQIPRFTPWDTRPLRFAARMWNNAIRVEPRLLPVDLTISTRTE